VSLSLPRNDLAKPVPRIMTKGPRHRTNTALTQWKMHRNAVGARIQACTLGRAKMMQRSSRPSELTRGGHNDRSATGDKRHGEQKINGVKPRHNRVLFIRELENHVFLGTRIDQKIAACLRTRPLTHERLIHERTRCCNRSFLTPSLVSFRNPKLSKEYKHFEPSDPFEPL
jgi:hypothetical protein